MVQVASVGPVHSPRVSSPALVVTRCSRLELPDKDSALNAE